MTKKTDKPQLDLTQAKIPGGVARFYTPMELPKRRKRLLTAYDISLLPKLRRLMIAQEIIDENGNKLVGDGIGTLPEGISIEESKQILEMNDAGAWAYLKGWNLHREGKPLPLPVDVDDMLDNPIYPGDLVDALVEHAAKIIAENMARNLTPDRAFTEAAAGDDESPFGESGA